MKRANFIVAGLLAVFGVYVLYLASKLPDFAHQNTTGPAFFPNLLVIVLFGLIVLLVGTTLRSETERSIGIRNKETLRSFKTMGAIFIYLLVFNYLGFLVSTWIFLFVLIHFLGEKRELLKAALMSTLATGIIYVVFKMLLLVPIPGGIFIG